MESKTEEKASQTTITSVDLEYRENTEKELLLKVKGLEKELVDLRKQCQELDVENAKLKKEVVRLNYELNNPRFCIDKYKDSDEDIAFYTGFPDYNAMMLC